MVINNCKRNDFTVIILYVDWILGFKVQEKLTLVSVKMYTEAEVQQSYDVFLKDNVERNEQLTRLESEQNKSEEDLRVVDY